ncbi:MAG: alpha/beta hydrolase [Saprospiraceae bacterium]
MRIFITVIFHIFIFGTLVCQKDNIIYLYKDSSERDRPAMFHFPPKTHSTGAAVLIFPGGGYQGLAMDHEGFDVANWFAEQGTTAFVVRYSLGKFDGSGHRHPDMLNDAKRAMRMVRSNADTYKILPDLIGVMGFSAGGHLASTLCTHFDDGDPNAQEIVEKISCLPNFCILGYPVIKMKGENTHWGSRRFLLGPTPKQTDIDELSNENHVSVATPPTFIFTTSDDKIVPVENSLAYFSALKSKGIPAELHVFEHGDHGKGLLVDDFALKQWSGLLQNWLIRWKIINIK